jgi:cytochrome P450
MIQVKCAVDIPIDFDAKPSNARRIAMTPITDVDLTSRAFRSDPYPTYARLRAEAPVSRVKLPDGQTVWLVTRYEDAVTVLKDPRFGNDREKIMTPEQAARLPWTPSVVKRLSRMMLNLDAPDHTRLRALVHKAFTPGLVANMLERIQALTDELLDAVQGRGRMDLIRDYALPLPSTIIAEMLGVPIHDRHRFHRWSNALVSASGSTWGMLMMLPAMWAFLHYIRKLVKSRQADPRDDLVSALVHARDANDRLSEDELLAMIFLLLLAGHETTLNLIGNGVLALLEHPAELDRLRESPDLIKPAVEELMRYDSPVQMASERYAREAVTIAGVTIERGETVQAMLGSANRDDRQFDRPDDLDITREPNRHLSFGLGVHYCVGAPLARLEGQIAINTLLRRFPELKLAVPRHVLRRRRGLGLRGLESLPVTLSRRRARVLQAAR